MAIQHQLVANRGEHGAGIVLLAGKWLFGRVTERSEEE
jgi:hypothetical protein